MPGLKSCGTRGGALAQLGAAEGADEAAETCKVGLGSANGAIMAGRADDLGTAGADGTGGGSEGRVLAAGGGTEAETGRDSEAFADDGLCPCRWLNG